MEFLMYNLYTYPIITNLLNLIVNLTSRNGNDVIKSIIKMNLLNSLRK